jgi:hypothetical protein
MQKFQLLFENDNGGMLMPVTVDSFTCVEPTPGDKRVELNLSNGDTIQVPINDTMQAKIEEPV